MNASGSAGGLLCDRKGRLNLQKFDAKMQAQLEGYLVAVGILQKGQTLSAQELPPETDAVSSLSAFEG